MLFRGKNRLSPSIRAIFTGIEGELLDTERLHYEKWEIQATRSGALSKEAFEEVWRTELIGIGDEAIYENLRKRAPQTFPSWKKCQKQNDGFYRANIHLAKIPQGIAESIQELRDRGVRIIVVTHAPADLTKIQLDYLERKTGISFEPNDVIVGERKNENAYSVALKRANEERIYGTSPLLPKNVLVLDNAGKYLTRAKELGMRFASIKIDLPKYLTPKHKKTSKFIQTIRSLNWGDIPRFDVLDWGPKFNPPAAMPK